MTRSLTLTALLVVVTAAGSLAAGVAVADPAGSGLANITLTKSVTSTSAQPVLGLSLVPDRARALPGDGISYTATVSNVGSQLTVNGVITAANGKYTTATVAAVWDEIEYRDVTTKAWVPLGGYAAAGSGYDVVVPPPMATGMAFDATGSGSSGVQYGVNGGIVGSVLQPRATATWSYRASLPLTTAQVRTLETPQAVGGIRNVIHFEVTPRQSSDGQPFTYRAAFDVPYLSSNGAATGVEVTITPPTGAPVSFDSSTTPSLGLLAAGDSVPVTTVNSVPVPNGKGVDETDADYVARLVSRDGAALDATADATAIGAVAAPTAHATVTETLPIGSVTKNGPEQVDAGSIATYQIQIGNVGSATAHHLSVVDVTPDGSQTAVTGVPADLAAGSSATLSTGYAVPADQPEGPVTDTAELTWQDANGNRYGPLQSSFTTTVAPSPVTTTLTLRPYVAGPDLVGTTQQLTATLLDRERRLQLEPDRRRRNGDVQLLGRPRGHGYCAGQHHGRQSPTSVQHRFDFVGHAITSVRSGVSVRVLLVDQQGRNPVSGGVQPC